MVTFADIQAARERIAPYIHHTPLIHSLSFSTLTGAEVHVKAENLQKTGSFKVRGAFNKLITERPARVIAASMGNHAQAVAFAATSLGIASTIVMPVGVAIVKEQATRGYGAQVELRGETLQKALEYAMSTPGYTFVHPYNDEAVIAGQGTLGIEMAEALDQIDVVLVPVGGGGLAAGTALAVKTLSPHTRVIGVQAAAATSAHDSFREGKVLTRVPVPTLADGIAVGTVGDKTLPILRDCLDGMLLVSEDTIAMAILLFLERKKFLVEGSGAVPLAAMIEHAGQFKGQRVVLVTSGGNIDLTLIDRIIHKGLVISGRMGVLEVTVDDVPGSLNLLTGIIAGLRGNILNVTHDRVRPDLPVGKTQVAIMVETRSRVHFDEIVAAIRERGFEVRT
jgi:threonine dehydratase